MTAKIIDFTEYRNKRLRQERYKRIHEQIYEYQQNII